MLSSAAGAGLCGCWTPRLPGVWPSLGAPAGRDQLQPASLRARPSCCCHHSRHFSPFCPPTSYVRSHVPLLFQNRDGGYGVLCFCNRHFIVRVQSCQTQPIATATSALLYLTAPTRSCCHCLFFFSQACELLKGRDCVLLILGSLGSCLAFKP